VDAISGATVTVIAENQVILRSGYEIARQVGILKAVERPAATLKPAGGERSWDQLLGEGNVQQLTVSGREVGVDTDGEPYIDLHFGYLNAPGVGRSVLGDSGYERLMADLKPGEHAIFIVANAPPRSRARGSCVAASTTASRSRRTSTLHLPRHRLPQPLQHPRGRRPRVPRVRHLHHPCGNFSAAYPWSLVFLANRVDQQTGARSFANFDREYWLAARDLEGGRPAYERPTPTWLRYGRARRPRLRCSWRCSALPSARICSATVWCGAPTTRTSAGCRFRNTSCGDQRRLVGFYAMAQPSITQVLTWFHASHLPVEVQLFLSDPFIFIFWWFIIATVFIWGAGCLRLAVPVRGAERAGIQDRRRARAQALPVQAAQALARQAQVDQVRDLRVAAGGVVLLHGLAERMAEVEPFKTTFLVGVWNRSWRSCCSGPRCWHWRCSWSGRSASTCARSGRAGDPVTFRFFGLKRKRECTSCKACAVGCGSLAIDARGRIDQRECLLCLDCMVMYYDAAPVRRCRRSASTASRPGCRSPASGRTATTFRLRRSPGHRPRRDDDTHTDQAGTRAWGGTGTEG